MELWQVLALCIALLVVALIDICLITNEWLTTTRYTVIDKRLPKNFSGLRLLQISDLHGKEFGKENQRLVEQIRKIKPDAILITGDILLSRRPNLGRAERLVRQVKEIAPVYYVSGNHEKRCGSYKECIDRLEEAGITVLEDRRVQIRRGEERVDLVGIKDRKKEELGATETFLGGVADPGAFQLLLAHRPERIELYAKYGFPLVFSGHAHGGQVRLPFIGGLIAPGQGLFPRMTSGVQHREKTAMVISRGLGNSFFPLRFLNPPELVEVTIKQGDATEIRDEKK